jgi:hypothetical protein
LRTIYCDNRTNFVGAQTELTKGVEAWNNSDMVDKLRLEGIEWHFGPPNASHWGGVYERLVQSAKKHLKVLLSEEALDSDVFVTILGGVESVMNNCPLTYVSADRRDPEALTLFNFLCPGVVVGFTVYVIPPVPLGDGINLRSSLQKSRRLVDEFWHRWSEEYVAMLQDRKKWKVSSPGIRVGQLVL